MKTKENLKRKKGITLVVLVALIIILNGISVYATSTILASQIKYKDAKTGSYVSISGDNATMTIIGIK